MIAVNVSCTVGGSSQTASASVDVYDDDVTPSDVQFTQSSAFVNEGDVVNLAVTKTGGSAQVRADSRSLAVSVTNSRA